MTDISTKNRVVTFENGVKFRPAETEIEIDGCREYVHLDKEYGKRPDLEDIGCSRYELFGCHGYKRTIFAGEGFEIASLPTREAREIARIVDEHERGAECYRKNPATSEYERYFVPDGYIKLPILKEKRLNFCEDPYDKHNKSYCATVNYGYRMYSLDAVVKLAKDKGYYGAAKLFKDLAQHPKVEFSRVRHDFFRVLERIKTEFLPIDNTDDMTGIRYHLPEMKYGLTEMQKLVRAGDRISRMQRKELWEARAVFKAIKREIIANIPKAGSDLDCSLPREWFEKSWGQNVKAIAKLGEMLGVKIPLKTYKLHYHFFRDQS